MFRWGQIRLADIIRWVIISDMAKKGWIATNSATVLWPNLLYRYHTTNERKPLQMVQGTFR